MFTFFHQIQKQRKFQKLSNPEQDFPFLLDNEFILNGMKKYFSYYVAL